MGHHTHTPQARKKKEARVESWACAKLEGPGTGLVVFADHDMGGTGEWFCTKGKRAVETARALKFIEEELYKLALKKLLP